jgi:hypothetical protein
LNTIAAGTTHQRSAYNKPTNQRDAPAARKTTRHKTLSRKNSCIAIDDAIAALELYLWSRSLAIVSTSFPGSDQQQLALASTRITSKPTLLGAVYLYHRSIMDHNGELPITQTVKRLTNLIQIELHFPFQSSVIIRIFAMILHNHNSFMLANESRDGF